jgi:hypothetical protein
MELLPFNDVGLDVNRGTATETYWWGFSLYLPNPFPVVRVNNWFWEIFFQVHTSWPHGGTAIDMSPPFSLQLNPSSNTSGGIRLLQRSYTGASPPTSTSDMVTVFNANIFTYTVGQWIDIVVMNRFDWSQGLTKVWVNGNLVRDYAGSNFYRDYLTAKSHAGIYNGWKNTLESDPDPVWERFYWLDQVRFSKSNAWNGDYNAVAPKGPRS